MDYPQQPKVLIDKGGDVVANVVDQPDRDKTHDAVNVRLKKISQNVTIEQFHRTLDVNSQSLAQS